ncbi:MAG: heavy-metal-associated domain-containing protein [archaeon]
MTKTTIQVKGMHCPSCEILIKEAVEEIDGVSLAHVDEKAGTAAIDFDETKTTLDRIKAAIKEEGYEVK